MEEEELAFLSAIVAEPDDDRLRLVYAEWLEEHGHCDRSVFLRLQVQAAAAPTAYKVPLAMLEEAVRLRDAGPAAWEAAVVPRLAPYFSLRNQYERGLLTGVRGEVGRLLVDLPDLWRLAPLRRVDLLDYTDSLARLLRLPELSRLRRLTVKAPSNPAETERFLLTLTASPPVAGLEYAIWCSALLGPPQIVGEDNCIEWLSPDDWNRIRAWNPSVVPC